MVAMAHFEANITSFMTVGESPPKIRSFQYIIDFDYKVVLVEQGYFYLESLKQASKYSSKYKVYNSLIKDNPDAIYSNYEDIKTLLIGNPH